MEVRYKDEGGGVQVAQLLLEEAAPCARDGNVLFVDKAEVSPLLNPTLDEQLGIDHLRTVMRADRRHHRRVQRCRRATRRWRVTCSPTRTRAR